MGWLSAIELRPVSALCIFLWKLFSDLDLRDARQQRFRSLQECFTRELKAGARPVDPHPGRLVSPCDAIIGACGRVDAGVVLQAKGFTFTLQDLLGDEDLARRHVHGSYVTMRITPTMYHRFHAPYDLRVEQVIYISGDTWNVYPIALQRVERLFCKNERAVLQCRLNANGAPITLVAVAAILVGSIRLHCVDRLFHLRYRGPNRIPCDTSYRKGEEMGWFQHGSTIIAFTPPELVLRPDVCENRRIRMGEPFCNCHIVSDE
jgi:phosphatidylserine decarboxylase